MKFFEQLINVLVVGAIVLTIVKTYLTAYPPFHLCLGIGQGSDSNARYISQ